MELLTPIACSSFQALPCTPTVPDQSYGATATASIACIRGTLRNGVLSYSAASQDPGPMEIPLQRPIDCVRHGRGWLISSRCANAYPTACVPKGSPRSRCKKKKSPPALQLRACESVILISHCSKWRVVTSRVRNNACSNSTAEAEPTYARARHVARGVTQQKRRSPLHS
jgi:hypothetical protein